MADPGPGPAAAAGVIARNQPGGAGTVVKTFSKAEVRNIVRDIRGHAPPRWAVQLHAEQRWRPLHGGRNAQGQIQAPVPYYGPNGVNENTLVTHRALGGVHQNCEIGAHADPAQDARMIYHAHIGSCRLPFEPEPEEGPHGTQPGGLAHPDPPEVAPAGRSRKLLMLTYRGRSHHSNMWERMVWEAIWDAEPNIVECVSICENCVTHGVPLCLMDLNAKGTGACLRCTAKKVKCTNTRDSAKGRVTRALDMLTGAAAASGAGHAWATDLQQTASDALNNLR